MDYKEEGPVGGQGQDREAEFQVHWSQEEDCVVNDDCSRVLERAWISEPHSRHGIAWARLRRTTIMTQLLAQPNGRMSKSMPARKGDASRYYRYLKTRRLEDRATWKLALAATMVRHDTPHLTFATPTHTPTRGVPHIFLKIPMNARKYARKKKSSTNDKSEQSRKRKTEYQVLNPIIS